MPANEKKQTTPPSKEDFVKLSIALKLIAKTYRNSHPPKKNAMFDEYVNSDAVITQLLGDLSLPGTFADPSAFLHERMKRYIEQAASDSGTFAGYFYCDSQFHHYLSLAKEWYFKKELLLDTPNDPPQEDLARLRKAIFLICDAFIKRHPSKRNCAVAIRDLRDRFKSPIDLKGVESIINLFNITAGNDSKHSLVKDVGYILQLHKSGELAQIFNNADLLAKKATVAETPASDAVSGTAEQSSSGSSLSTTPSTAATTKNDSASEINNTSAGSTQDGSGLLNPTASSEPTNAPTSNSASSETTLSNSALTSPAAESTPVTLTVKTDVVNHTANPESASNSAFQAAGSGTVSADTSSSSAIENTAVNSSIPAADISNTQATSSTVITLATSTSSNAAAQPQDTQVSENPVTTFAANNNATALSSSATATVPSASSAAESSSSSTAVLDEKHDATPTSENSDQAIVRLTNVLAASADTQKQVLLAMQAQAAATAAAAANAKTAVTGQTTKATPKPSRRQSQTDSLSLTPAALDSMNQKNQNGRKGSLPQGMSESGPSLLTATALAARNKMAPKAALPDDAMSVASGFSEARSEMSSVSTAAKTKDGKYLNRLAATAIPLEDLLVVKKTQRFLRKKGCFNDDGKFVLPAKHPEEKLLKTLHEMLTAVLINLTNAPQGKKPTSEIVFHYTAKERLPIHTLDDKSSYIRLISSFNPTQEALAPMKAFNERALAEARVEARRAGGEVPALLQVLKIIFHSGYIVDKNPEVVTTISARIKQEEQQRLKHGVPAGSAAAAAERSAREHGRTATSQKAAPPASVEQDRRSMISQATTSQARK